MKGYRSQDYISGGGSGGQQMVDGQPGQDVMVASTSSMGGPGQNQNEMNSSILKVSGPSVHQRAQSLQQAVGQVRLGSKLLFGELHCVCITSYFCLANAMATCLAAVWLSRHNMLLGDCREMERK